MEQHLEPVRLAEAADLPALEELVASCTEAPRWPAGTWQAFVDPHGGEGLHRALFVVGEPQMTLAGVLAITRIGQTTEMELLLVHPAFRRRGLGRLLSKAWLEWAPEAGAWEALLEVRASNVAAQSLYEQLGFVLEGRRRGYYRQPDEDALLMRLDLPPGGVVRT